MDLFVISRRALNYHEAVGRLLGGLGVLVQGFRVYRWFKFRVLGLRVANPSPQVTWPNILKPSRPALKAQSQEAPNPKATKVQTSTPQRNEL